MKYLTDDQYDELMDYLQGMDMTQTEGLKRCGFEGYRLTKEQRQHRDENWKRCRRCGCWIGICDGCTCI